MTSPRVIGVAASSGGPAALVTILGGLPADFPGCIAVVQHVAPGFSAPLARMLASAGPLPVNVVTQRTTPAPGTVLIAPEDRHLVLLPEGAFVPLDTAKVGGHRPSATLFFQSLAAVLGPRAVGLVLTGIGDDGAAGLAELRRAGGLTLAQDEASCAVHGMPRAAALAGGVAEVLPLAAIADRLVLAARVSRAAR